MEHPITPPPPELVKQWTDMWYATNSNDSFSVYIATVAAQWGADQELEACCAAVSWFTADILRAARRPKPPSLKEQALEAATRFYAKGHEGCTDEEVKDDFDAICRALEQLND
jgi:hypothetical protein